LTPRQRHIDERLCKEERLWLELRLATERWFSEFVGAPLRSRKNFSDLLGTGARTGSNPLFGAGAGQNSSRSPTPFPHGGKFPVFIPASPPRIYFKITNISFIYCLNFYYFEGYINTFKEKQKPQSILASSSCLRPAYLHHSLANFNYKEYRNPTHAPMTTTRPTTSLPSLHHPYTPSQRPTDPVFPSASSLRSLSICAGVPDASRALWVGESPRLAASPMLARLLRFSVQLLESKISSAETPSRLPLWPASPPFLWNLVDAFSFVPLQSSPECRSQMVQTPHAGKLTPPSVLPRYYACCFISLLRLLVCFICSCLIASFLHFIICRMVMFLLRKFRM